MAINILRVDLTPGNFFMITSLALALYIAFDFIYNLLFHPLRSFPGPLLWRCSRLPYTYHLVRGTLPFQMLGLHKHYGTVVRIGPDELAFADGAAWKDIQGHRGPGEPELGKSPRFYALRKGQPPTITSANREDHARMRRQLAHGFSERSMREQQPIIMQYVDLLIKRLYENCDGGRAQLNMLHWDLTFGEPFDCLKSSHFHPWVAIIFSTIKLAAFSMVGNYFPWVRRALLLLVPKHLKASREDHLELTRQKLQKRIDLGAERPDFMEGFLGNKDKIGMSQQQLQLTSSLLILAGSETTATLLSGVSYLLTTNKPVLARLCEEVRGAFKSEDEINFVSVGSLEYMLACLNEGLRMYPPAPVALPRLVPEGGAVISGYRVPAGTTVGLWHWALYRNEKFFALPNEFHPERWLGKDPRFANDDREIFQPFSYGPRNCIGKNLAYVEMRTILARILWNFDIELAEDSKDWIERQRVYVLWEKLPLNIYLTPRIKELDGELAS